ncbi:peptidyl-prolyl cis-trans isomerase CYP95-like, partial [Neltuma alba]|uniref:peptidyl-prolyl cis-trans isomerase CYP95-like n=1 Tax=Neltuma alba TaxID=207710 RepID=UPI0010A385DE
MTSYGGWRLREAEREMDSVRQEWLNDMASQLLIESSLCPGEKGVSPKTKRPLGYKHCFFLTVNEGDSYVKLKHDKEGLLSMSRRDQEASCSHFVLTLKADQSLASSHVIFGKIVEGLGKLREIRDYNFFMLFRIINCGVSYNARDILTDVIIKPCPPYAVSCEGEQ